MRKAILAAAAVALILLCGAVPGARAGETLSIEAFYGNF